MNQSSLLLQQNKPENVLNSLLILRKPDTSAKQKQNALVFFTSYLSSPYFSLDSLDLTKAILVTFSIALTGPQVKEYINLLIECIKIIFERISNQFSSSQKKGDGILAGDDEWVKILAVIISNSLTLLHKDLPNNLKENLLLVLKNIANIRRGNKSILCKFLPGVVSGLCKWLKDGNLPSVQVILSLDILESFISTCCDLKKENEKDKHMSQEEKENNDSINGKLKPFMVSLSSSMCSSSQKPSVLIAMAQFSKNLLTLYSDLFLLNLLIIQSHPNLDDSVRQTLDIIWSDPVFTENSTALNEKLKNILHSKIIFLKDNERILTNESLIISNLQIIKGILDLPLFQSDSLNKLYFIDLYQMFKRLCNKNKDHVKTNNSSIKMDFLLTESQQSSLFNVPAISGDKSSFLGYDNPFVEQMICLIIQKIGKFNSFLCKMIELIQNDFQNDEDDCDDESVLFILKNILIGAEQCRTEPSFDKIDILDILTNLLYKSSVSDNFIKLTMDCIASIAVIMKQDFSSTIQLTIYPILSRIGMPNIILFEYSLYILKKISVSCNYSSHELFLQHNIDYIINNIIIQMKYSSENQDIIVAGYVLLAVLKITKSLCLPHIDECLQIVVEMLENNQTDEIISPLMIRIFKQVISCMAEIVPKKVTLPEESEAHKTTIHAKRSKSILEEYIENHKKIVKEIEEIEMRVKEQEKDTDEESLAEEIPTDNTSVDTSAKTEKSQEEHNSLLIIKNISHFIHSSSQFIRLSCLELLTEAIPLLASLHSSELLQIIHRIWPSSLLSLSDSFQSTKLAAIKVIKCCILYGSSFCRDRVHKEFIPKASEALSNLSQKLNARITNSIEYKESIDLILNYLECLQVIVDYIALNQETFEKIFTSLTILLTLNNDKNEIISHQIRNIITSMARADPDSIWFYLNCLTDEPQIYSHESFATIDFSQYSLTENKKNNKINEVNVNSLIGKVAKSLLLEINP